MNGLSSKLSGMAASEGLGDTADTTLQVKRNGTAGADIGTDAAQIHLSRYAKIAHTASSFAATGGGPCGRRRAALWASESIMFAYEHRLVQGRRASSSRGPSRRERDEKFRAGALQGPVFPQAYAGFRSR